MLKIIIQDQRYLSPFNERARDLRIQNKPLWLIQRFLKAGVMIDGTRHDTERGVPQGACVSPLLANVYQLPSLCTPPPGGGRIRVGHLR